jgi:hypothetical protein
MQHLQGHLASRSGTAPRYPILHQVNLSAELPN